MQVSTSAPASRPATAAIAKRQRTVVHDTTATDLVSHTPVNAPPSLRERHHAQNDLFLYYAIRGNGEVTRSKSAVQAALACPGGSASAATLFAPSSAWCDDTSGDVRGREQQPLMASSASHAVMKDVTATTDTSLESGEPLFPRLRPSAADDARQSAYARQAREAAKREALRTRKQCLLLPTTESYYSALYTPDAPLTNHIRDTLQESAKKKMAEAAAMTVSMTVEEHVASAGSRSGRGAAGERGTQDRSGRLGNGNPNASMRSSSLQGGGVVGQSGVQTLSSRSAAMSGRRSPQMELTDRASPGVFTTTETFARFPPATRPDDATDVHAALLRESHAQTAKEIEDLFVATYYIQHPDARARQQAAAREESRHRSARAASLAMGGTHTSNGAARRSVASRSPSTKNGAKKSSKKAKKSAPPPPRDGAPAPNLRFFLTRLIAHADDQGRISQAQFEAVLQDVPFEVMNQEALRDLFALLRQFSQAKQREIAFLAAGVSGSPHGYADSSIASTGSAAQTINNNNSKTSPAGAVAQSMRSLLNGRSSVMPAQASTRLSVGSRSAGMTQGSVETQPNLNHANSTQYPSLSGAAGGAGAAAVVPPRTSPVVYVRELISALDELLNGDETRDVVRWTCFNVLASSGQGYIHKATLASLRHQHREECEGPQAEITASMVKALSDCFDTIAREEEDAYLSGGGKGKKKKKSKKAPVLASNQKSVIPLNVMRVSHMNYSTFCRFFEALPQLAAAFTHVWLSLLFSGSIVPATTSTAATNAAMGSGAAAEPSGADGEPFSRAACTSRAGPASPLATVSSRGAESGDELHRAQNNEGSGSLGQESARRASASASSPGVQIRQNWPREFVKGLEGPPAAEPGTYPLWLLGSDSIARRAAVQRVIVSRLEYMKTGMEDLQNEQ